MAFIRKNNRAMEVFNEFIASISNVYKQNNKFKSLIEIYPKNLQQIIALSSVQEIESLKMTIISSIKKEYCNFGLSEIFEYHDSFFCLIEEDEKKLVRSASILIHNNLSSDLSNEFFADIRIAGLKLGESENLNIMLPILCDQMDYMNDNLIFNWIEQPKQIIYGLKKDYGALLELRKSIIGKTACFAFQPIVKCNTGETGYYECLLRLNDEGHKLISAGSYIMLAEKYGYISSVDKYVFDMAVNELKSTQDISLSVNISNIGVQDRNLVRYIESLITEAGVGHRMIIEITETAMNDNLDQTKYFVEAMKALGCKIALDDFGSGYTSFNQVRCFPIDVIKIDGSYIRSITTNAKNKILVEALIKTAEELGCKTVAEFVENGEIAKTLIELKVDYMQGNFFSPALNYRSWEKL